MRDLTEEELKLAPDWATHYIVDSDESIIYESEKLCWWVGLREPLNNEGSLGNLSNRAINTFDITKHEFGDTVGFVDLDGSELTLNCTGCNYIELYRGDAIAIAKALGVTGEDLK